MGDTVDDRFTGGASRDLALLPDDQAALDVDRGRVGIDGLEDFDQFLDQGPIRSAEAAQQV